MSWSGGIFSRVLSSWAEDTGVANITRGRHDTNDNDLATGINACLAKNGSNLATATFYDDFNLIVDSGLLKVGTVQGANINLNPSQTSIQEMFYDTSDTPISLDVSSTCYVRTLGYMSYVNIYIVALTDIDHTKQRIRIAYPSEYPAVTKGILNGVFTAVGGAAGTGQAYAVPYEGASDFIEIRCGNNVNLPQNSRIINVAGFFH